jgi:A/G-specific adenine glycosylase
MPRCDACPVSELCAAFQQGKQDQIPGAKAKPNIEAVREAAVVIWNRGKVFVRRRSAGERWAGLWDFVRFPVEARRGTALRREMNAKIHEQTGLAIGEVEKIATLKHGVTRFRITLDCYRAAYAKSQVRLSVDEWRWMSPQELESLPLSVTGRKLSRLIEAE